MILLIALTALIISGHIGDRYYGGCSDWPFMVKMVGYTVLGIILIMALVIRINTMSEIKQFESVQETVLSARTNGDPIESTALQLAIVDGNKWLADVQFTNGLFIIGDMIPDDVDNLEPIR